MARAGSIDYPRVTKTGFLAGIVLFALGSLGELVIHVGWVTVPAWEATLLFDLEVLGVAMALFVPLVFGIVLPLLE